MHPPTEAETRSTDLVSRAKRIGTATFSDVLDSLGVNGVMSGIVRRSGQGRVAGYARTVDCRVGLLGAFDMQDFAVFPIFNSVETNTVLVMSLGGAEVSTFGGLAALTVSHRNAAGVVIDGACRDVEDLRATGLSVASRHVTPRSGRGRMTIVSRGEPVVCGGVTVKHGDLIVIDDTGIAVIPFDRLQDVVTQAETIEMHDDAKAAAVRNQGQSDLASETR